MRGLVNLGSTCYLNCIIQALSVLNFSLPDLLFFKHLNGLFNELKENGSPSSAYSVLQALNCPTTQQDAQEALIKVIDRLEEDTKELIIWISHLFHGFTKFQKQLEVIDYTGQMLAIRLVVTESRAVRLVNDKSKVIKVHRIHLPQTDFTGTVLSVMTCSNCKRPRVNLSKTHIFQFNLPESLEMSVEEMARQITEGNQSRIGFSLLQLFQNFAKEELLDSVHCEFCTIQDTKAHLDELIKKSSEPVKQGLDRLKNIINSYPDTANIDDINLELLDDIKDDLWVKNGYPHVRKTTVGYLPKFLIIQCMRSQYTSFGEQKNSTFVSFPFQMKMSELSPFLFGNSLNNTTCHMTGSYQLKSVVEHQGIHNYGHYISYKYNKEEDQWYHLSDDSVSKVAESVVERAEAYLLIYELGPEIEETTKSATTAEEIK